MIFHYRTISYEERSSPTNAFSSSVENEVIRREKYTYKEIDVLELEKQKRLYQKEIIDNILELLELVIRDVASVLNT